MAEHQQGTGKHGHKDSEQPWPHHGGSDRSEGSGDGRSQGNDGSGSRGERQSGQSEEHSLQEREYRGPDGEIHHHTNTYMEQHGEGGGNR